MNDNDCEVWENTHGPWALWGKSGESVNDKGNETPTVTITTAQAPVLSTAYPVAMNQAVIDRYTLSVGADESECFDADVDSDGDASSFCTVDCISEPSPDPVTGLSSGVELYYPHPTVATVEQRLQEAVDEYISMRHDCVGGVRVKLYIGLRTLGALQGILHGTL
jgi:hypothetical protein